MAERLRILVVDDDPSILRALTVRLSHAGYQVEVAASGMAALGLLETFSPDLALLDVNMPGIDGLELAAALDQVAGQAIAKVFFTASQDPALRERAARMGISRMLDKPFDSRQLLEALASAHQADRHVRTPGAPPA